MKILKIPKMTSGWIVAFAFISLMVALLIFADGKQNFRSPDKSPDMLNVKVIAAYPFLADIPEPYLQRLHFDSLALPDTHLLAAKAQLENEIAAHVVIYKGGHGEVPKEYLELCHTLRAASLNDYELRLLHDFQALTERNIVVAYAKPIQLHEAR